jgi:septum formation protein
MQPQIILASGSPRRRELLREIVPVFDVVVPQVDEEALSSPNPVQSVERLATAKVLAVQADHPGALVIGGDTIVVINGVVLNKPRDPLHAIEMLASLSGQTHQVLTGVCMAYLDRVRVFSEMSNVTFRSIGPDEIKAYVASGEPMDKAGGYAIQGGAADFVFNVEGSTSNVVGLPLERLTLELSDFLATAE